MNLQSPETYTPSTIARDFLSSIIVFLVALPLCLGIAMASDAKPIAGLISGIIGGIIIGLLSGSHTSVSGPAAGLTAIVAAQIGALNNNFEAFLLAVFLSGIIQLGFGLARAGALSAFFPSSVIKGLLAAIGVILILKQLPLLFGYEKDMGLVFGHSEALEDFLTHPDQAVDRSHAFGDIFISFYQAFKALLTFQGGPQWGAIAIGFFSLAFLIGWDKVKVLKRSLVPAPLIVVIVSGLLAYFFIRIGGSWTLTPQQLVDVPSIANWEEMKGVIRTPDFSQLGNKTVYIAAITIAVVASLETLLNLDAVDKLDRKQRISPPNRELFAQGVGNMCCGLIGGIPVTSVVIRGSVNVNSGAQTKLSAIFHGILLLGCVLLIPHLLQLIPLACLAAILLQTGFKLASPVLFKQMWREGRYQFLPFILTLVAIVMTDLLVGILIGLFLALLFILYSNLRVPIKRIHEKHIDGDILHIELPNQVSFLNKAALETALREAPRGSHVLLDARRTDYIDPDVLSLIQEFDKKTAPAFDLTFQILGMKDRYQQVSTATENIDFSIQEARETLTPADVTALLAEGNRRFVEGHPLDRDLRHRLQNGNGKSAYPIAVFLTGIDSQTPIEMIFDLGLGEAFVVRTPGGVIGPRIVGGIEYATSVGGVKVVVVLGHADSSLLSLAIKNAYSPENKAAQAGCAQLEEVLEEIAVSIDQQEANFFPQMTPTEQAELMVRLARRNVQRTISLLPEMSPAVKQLVHSGKLAIIGALFNVNTNEVEFFEVPQTNLTRPHR